MGLLRLADDHDRELFKNIFNMYQNELSVFADDFKYLDRGGYFDRSTVDEIFPPDESIFPFVICEGQKNYGLLLITKEPYAPNDADYCIEELYLVNYQRRRGIATKVLLEYMSTHKGRYSIFIYNKNEPAFAFWKSFIINHGKFINKTSDGDNLTKILFDVE